MHIKSEDTPQPTAILGATLVTLADAGWGLIEDGAVVWEDDTIVYAGPRAEMPKGANAYHQIFGGGSIVTPGLIDCHTHLVFGGDRVDEFEQRLEGASYETIARNGGGIASSIRATRAADFDTLLTQSLARAKALAVDGVTTLEIKSGYGLDTASEMKMLRVARAIGEAAQLDVRTTFLGAHALPPEFKDRADAYIDLVVDEMLPAVAEAGLADAVDAFCESIGFTPAQTRRVFERARELGLPVKLHADQLGNLGGAALAADFDALSADHLEHTDEAGVRAMAASGTVAVLLPGAFYSLRETRLPPIDLLRKHGVPMAVASDQNPGTSPLLSLRLAMSMASTLFRMTPLEALRGTTINAARALGLEDRGVILPGKRADLVLWNARHPAELCYWIGGALAEQRVLGGNVV